MPIEFNRECSVVGLFGLSPCTTPASVTYGIDICACRWTATTRRDSLRERVPPSDCGPIRAAGRVGPAKDGLDHVVQPVRRLRTWRQHPRRLHPIRRHQSRCLLHPPNTIPRPSQRFDTTLPDSSEPNRSATAHVLTAPRRGALRASRAHDDTRPRCARKIHACAASR